MANTKNQSDRLSDSTPSEIWQKICVEAQIAAMDEPVLAGFLQTTILNHDNLGKALSYHLASKLDSSATPILMLRDTFAKAFAHHDIAAQIALDISATFHRDSACSQYISPFLYYKGFLALQSYRAAHNLWMQGHQSLALLLQHQVSLKFAVDIHPAARIGAGVMLDHATGLVVGETAVIEDCVSIMQSVTLGGTGKESGDRHPKIRRGVLIGPGAKILGNIDVGEGAMVAASSVVLKPVPPHAVVAGVPAAIIGRVDCDEPSKAMNHYFNCD